MDFAVAWDGEVGIASIHVLGIEYFLLYRWLFHDLINAILDLSLISTVLLKLFSFFRIVEAVFLVLVIDLIKFLFDTL